MSDETAEDLVAPAAGTVDDAVEAPALAEEAIAEDLGDASPDADADADIELRLHRAGLGRGGPEPLS